MTWPAFLSCPMDKGRPSDKRYLSILNLSCGTDCIIFWILDLKPRLSPCLRSGMMSDIKRSIIGGHWVQGAGISENRNPANPDDHIPSRIDHA